MSTDHIPVVREVLLFLWMLPVSIEYYDGQLEGIRINTIFYTNTKFRSHMFLLLI
jgi:hypothetical protein